MNSNYITKQSGAALLTVLVVSIALLMLMTMSATILDQRLKLAEKSKQRFRELVAIKSEVARIQYLFATNRLTRAGLVTGDNQEAYLFDDGNWNLLLTGDEIRVDGYSYEKSTPFGPLTFSIQSENGLIPINTSQQYWLRRWLTQKGLDSFEVAQLSDAIYDYADEDDWQKPAGGEKPDYIKQGLNPPTNFLLQTPSEIHNVLRWREIAEQSSLPLSLSRSPSLNLNAVPLSLLEELWPNYAQQIYENRRNGNWFMTPELAESSIGETGLTDLNLIDITPSVSFIITLKMSTVTKQYRLEISRSNERAVNVFSL